MTDYIKEYNIIVNQLNKNINSLKTINKRQSETIKKLRKELSIERKENRPNNIWAEVKNNKDI